MHQVGKGDHEASSATEQNLLCSTLEASNYMLHAAVIEYILEGAY